ncbi:hypothetical protein [Hymenobacter jejuensis]|uniref:Porin family protein n=1 Tax=Hymenobacter jejuensis TaxID=2502781 RepID=A0A5B7ZVD0_9BACT|nr:hypothetical protein [Hymenobacter jejuensis]QDA59174.1 hypothetical protein FHG12_03225 [Hymenobacter jejuensis]
MLRFLYSTGLLALLVLAQAGSAMAQSAPVSAAEPAPVGLKAPRVSYSLNAGAMFAGRYGSATYLSPTASYRLTDRFHLFGGVTYLHSMPGTAFFPAEGSRLAGMTMGTNHYLVQGGGTYALSDRVALTGSAWKDLSNMPAARGFSPYSGLGNMGSGVNLRADFQVTEHLSVSGGVRVSNGYTPGLLGSPYAPFGY